MMNLNFFLNKNKIGNYSSTNQNKNKRDSLPKKINLSTHFLQIDSTNLDIKLRGNITLPNSQEDIRRKMEFRERENPICEKAQEMKGENVKSFVNSKELKTLSSNDIEQCIQFELISEVSSLPTKESINVVCGIHLKVTQPNEEKERIPMDLVCVIDDSKSMMGMKAQLVRKSIKYLLKIMNEDDRISLISFDSKAKILCPLLRNNLANKKNLKQAINSVSGKGSTNIEAGIEAGLWMINNRKEKNPVTCMFLLTDGIDDQPNVDIRIQKLISEYKVQDTFIINSYGYGSDHDSKQMRNIAETHKGGYYYIEDVKKVSEWFVLSISGLLSAVGEDLRITIKQKNKDITSLNISQLYGGDQLWVKQNLQKGEAQLYLPHLVVGDDKFFVFDATFNHTQFQMNDATRSLVAFEAELEVKAVKQESIVRIQRSLQFEYKEVEFFEIQDNSYKDYYEELKVTRQRAVGGMKIKQATNLINLKHDYAQAKQILQKYKLEIQELGTLKQNNGIKHLDEDLEDAIQKCEPRRFRQASFDKMEVIHCQRKNSICHREDWNKDQVRIMKKFKAKEICLSDDSCSDSEDDNKRPSSAITKNKFIHSLIIQKPNSTIKNQRSLVSQQSQLRRNQLPFD